MYVAQFRADDIYTSQITSAVWVDPKLLRLELVPGQTEPGGTWAHPPYVTPADLRYLVSAFNGGFRFSDAQGGIYLEGRAGVQLIQGAASFVIYQSGEVNIGAWGTDVTMSPGVESVLQNVVLLVDNGQLAPSATYTDNAIWGYTLGGGYVVPHSGIGVTANGALVYVAGPALTAKSLAESLQRAGAVRAMTFDINAALRRPVPAACAGVTRFLRAALARGDNECRLTRPIAVGASVPRLNGLVRLVLLACLGEQVERGGAEAHGPEHPTDWAVESGRRGGVQRPAHGNDCGCAARTAGCRGRHRPPGPLSSLAPCVDRDGIGSACAPEDRQHRLPFRALLPRLARLSPQGPAARPVARARAGRGGHDAHSPGQRRRPHVCRPELPPRAAPFAQGELRAVVRGHGVPCPGPRFGDGPAGAAGLGGQGPRRHLRGAPAPMGRRRQCGHRGATGLVANGTGQLVVRPAFSSLTLELREILGRERGEADPSGGPRARARPGGRNGAR